MRLPIVCLLLLAECFAYKFLVYNPLFGHSHTTFLSRIADTLTEAGHDVTVLFPIYDEMLVNKTAIKSNAKQILVEQDPRVGAIWEHLRQGMLKDIWVMNSDIMSMLKMAANFTLTNEYTCEALTANSGLLERLRAEEFDVGIAEPMTLCGFGIFDHLGIKKTIGALSVVQMDIISMYIGEPLAPSYVPNGMANFGEQMSIFERMKNAFGTYMGTFFLKGTFEVEAKALTANLGKDYTSIIEDLIARASFMFTNSNPYLNYPRPLIHKTVEIGGISVDVKNVGELGEWDKVLNERKHTVFISFGSMAKSKDMPAEWKKSFIALMESLPEVTFIWKYEEPTDFVDHLPNVHLNAWLPQNALLSDPRLSLFITHGGLGSTTELAHFGKACVVIPLFGDQPRNARMLVRHGGGLLFEKTDLDNVELLKKTVNTILNDNSYAENASRMAQLLQEQPIAAKDLVISHSEFTAKYGPLEQIDPYGRHLNILQYHLVDVLAFIVLVVLAIVVLMWVTIRAIFRKVCGSSCKKDKDALFDYKKKKLQ